MLTLQEMLPAELEGDGVRLDPTKLTITLAAEAGSAGEVQRALYERFSIQVEKVTHNTLSLLVTLGTTRGKVLRLLGALQALDEAPRASASQPRPPVLPPIGPMRMLPRDAYFSAGELLPLAADSHARNETLLGRISADQVTPYPPGIPVLVPGQEITGEVLDYLLDLLHDESDSELHGVLRRDGMALLRVVPA